MADPISVKVRSLGTNREVALPPGSTVEDALKLAQIDPNLEVRIGGEGVSSDTQLNGDEVLTAVPPKVKHGN